MSDPSHRISREVLDQGQQWSAERVAAEIGRSVGALKSLRKRGQFPGPDGHLGRVPWWHPSSVQDWLQNQQLPPTAVVGRQAAARTLQITITQLDTYELPPADGTRHGHSWWLTSTLHTWAGRVFADVLVTVDQVHDLVGCSDEEWIDLQDELPVPFLAGPERWWPKQVRAWVQARGTRLRTDPEVLFVRDIPEVCGLAADSVRRYRWFGLLPDPDGSHRGRPWWHRETILDWDKNRNRSHAPTAVGLSRDRSRPTHYY